MKTVGKFIGTLVVTLGLVAAQNVSAKDIAWTTPLVKGYGPIKYDPTLAMQPDKTLDYKVVFKVVKPKNKAGVNAKLWHVARLLNLLYAGGVPKDHIHLVVVIAGGATPIVLTNKAYNAKFLTDNPDMKLIRALSEQGVKFYVCSQAVAEHHFKLQDVNKYITKSLSAITDLSYFQLHGYAML